MKPEYIAAILAVLDKLFEYATFRRKKKKQPCPKQGPTKEE